MNTVTPVADNILVAGEAAGLVNPLNGEGIGTAVLSGELAARHAVAALQQSEFTAGYLWGYARDLRRYIGRNHFLARLLRDIIAWPGVMNRVVQRAQKDRAFAQNLFEVIVEIRSPRAIFSPGFLAKLMAG
jgi:flavin-dependent dehydrogenase